MTTMPASMPDDTATGMRATRLVSGLKRPVAINRTAVAMKAPTASFMVKPEEAATSAAPGVDQAVTIGIR